MNDKPDYTPKSNEAEWHITYKCDLNCPNCNRLCFLPPTTPDMTLDDAWEFNRQARELGWFPKIVILGGEPTLHRDLFAFIDIASELSPGRVEVWSNGYGPHNNGEDQELAGRLNEAGAKCCDPCSFAKPFYIYRYDNNSYHLSYMDDAGYRSLGDGSVSKSHVQPGWFRDFSSMPVRQRFIFAPHANTGNEQQRIELIGPVDGPGGDGPSNGMYALQKELRKRVDAGLDWLTIKSLPATRDAIPWFWNWADRRYAAWWDEQGLPFVQGPNMLFVNSGTPRIDAEECALLDAANCQAMFCHTPWYRDLIAEHRGPANQSEIILWPYPIDPWPGEPLPDEYDLLIYAKNGHRPQLLEHLADAFPRHVQIHYGRYRREELFEAARRSRACAYLADDDHGPLALQEILLAGCPTVGVRTGASFVRNGETGIVVDRLPPGRQCAESDEDARALTVFMAAIEQAQTMDRHSVRDRAVGEFDTDRIVGAVITSLDPTRLSGGQAVGQTGRQTPQRATKAG